jgi:hypothetical protein
VKLGSQVFVSHTTPEPHLIEPVENGSDLFWKPRKGGMWTSTLDEEGGEWVRWLNGEGYPLEDERWGGKLWLLSPAEANVYVVAGPKELFALHEQFPLAVPASISELKMFRRMVDWEAASQVYDAIWVPNPWAYRFLTPGIGSSEEEMEEAHQASMFFYVMDAECTCWFRWCFEGEPQLLDLSVTTTLGS